MIDKILRVNNSTLDSINIDNSNIIESEFAEYYISNSGKEHYRLLTYISGLYDDKILIDVGTYKGCSANALATNENNIVYTFNLLDQVRLYNKPKNINFILDNIINYKYVEIITNSPFIILDTDHTGKFELEFYKYLKELNYSGLLLLDDIFLNKEMTTFWNNLEHRKYDITHIGHWSGTGLVDMGELI